MKKILISILLVASALCANAQVSKETIAVTKVGATKALTSAMQKNGTTATMERVLESMDANLSSAIQATRKFEVVSRSDIDAVMKEQDFMESGNADASGKGAAKLGEIKGAKYIVVLAVDDFQDYVRKVNFASLGKQTEVRIIRFGAVAKIIDSSKGSILETVNFVISNEGRNAEFNDAQISGGSATDSIIAELARKMSADIANRVADIIFPAKIIGKTGKIGTFNRGDGTGVVVGDEYEIFALGEEMVDPDTGEKLGAEEISVGTLTVTSVAPKFSRGKILEDNGVEKGQVLRLKKKAVIVKPEESEEL